MMISWIPHDAVKDYLFRRPLASKLRKHNRVEKSE